MPKGRWKAGCKHQPVPLERPGTEPAAQPSRGTTGCSGPAGGEDLRSDVVHEDRLQGSAWGKAGVCRDPKSAASERVCVGRGGNWLSCELCFRMVPIISTLVWPGAVGKLLTLSWGFTSKRHRFEASTWKAKQLWKKCSMVGHETLREIRISVCSLKEAWAQLHTTKQGSTRRLTQSHTSQNLKIYTYSQRQSLSVMLAASHLVCFPSQHIRQRLVHRHWDRTAPDVHPCQTSDSSPTAPCKAS